MTAPTEKRRYNRRASDASPPYYETFDRIATALEELVEVMREFKEGKVTIKLPE